MGGWGWRRGPLTLSAPFVSAAGSGVGEGGVSLFSSPPSPGEQPSDERGLRPAGILQS